MSEDKCEEHETKIPEYADKCPYCQLEEDARAQERELQQRNAPLSVDDPAQGTYGR